jgi:Pectate lyase superfamily protein
MWRCSRLSTACTAAAAFAAALAACGSPAVPSPSPTPQASATPRGPVFDVTRFGARGDGSSDNTAAFAQAIASAQTAGGGTVYVPPGRYLFSTRRTPYPGSVAIEGTVAVTLQGAGRDATTLIQASSDKNLVNVRVDGSVVEDITLDAQTHNGAAAIVVVANHTSLLRARVLGGDKHFAIYYAGPPGASADSPSYNVGNRVNDLDLNDLDCNDGFSWSFQEQSTISDVTHTGSRLALYLDATTTVSDYRYTPGPQQCGARNAVWLTPPAHDITIENFVSAGEGGKIGVISPQHAGRVATNVTIHGLTMTAPGYQLTIGDVRNLVLDGCDLHGDSIVVVAQVVAQGDVSHCTYGQLLRRSAPGAQVSIAASAS